MIFYNSCVNSYDNNKFLVNCNDINCETVVLNKDRVCCVLCVSNGMIALALLSVFQMSLVELFSIGTGHVGHMVEGVIFLKANSTNTGMS